MTTSRVGVSPYPKPGPVGGRLIRELIGFLKSQKFELPISSHILCAISGGLDSTALATLVARYGRRVVDSNRLVLLHVNHGWRGAESDADSRFVRELARKWDVQVRRFRLGKSVADGRSWEEAAREARQRIYRRMSAEYGNAPVLTAHHADDLAETMLWRLFTGTSRTHGAGIVARHGVELRPFLKVRKAELRAFLKEEGLAWREDRTNHEGRFLRSRMRQELMPVIEKLFPRAIERLVDLARTEIGSHSESSEGGVDEASLLFAASGLAARRAHWEAVRELRGTRSGELHLPGGWRLKKECEGAMPEKWVLERLRRDSSQ